MAVVLIGTLDTKGTEFRFVRDLLHQQGLATLVIDASVLGSPTFAPDVPRDELYAAAGTSLETVQRERDRGRAIDAAARGAAKVVTDLWQQRKVDGILGLGGSAGTTIGTAAMRAVPFGVPKLMVSTLASGQVQHYVGVRDILMMPSVVDISGLNRVSRTVLTNAALAMGGMVRKPAERPDVSADKPLITATMFGVTTPCVEAARKQLEAKDYEVLVFHATGTGGRTMESFITDGLIAGVLDITTTELADELVGGVLSAGPDRLTAAALRGIPQVISLGALDMVNFGPPETVPEKLRSRRFYQHNPTVTLMRTTPDENDRLGKEIAHKASAARSPTAVLVPLRGVSAIDIEGGPFWWPEADQALFQSLRNWMSPEVQLVELDLHINDPQFAQAAVDMLLRQL
ncbi:MAG TPA: Tm-1-like ATP-binding domain-containing protein [Gemmataceae bacterium]|nr:Tm-1-like ATP-binding domain-containing protein [Gemmataceae bacterium]